MIESLMKKKSKLLDIIHLDLALCSNIFVFFSRDSGYNSPPENPIFNFLYKKLKLLIWSQEK